MKFLEKLEIIGRIDALIKRKATGTPDQLAGRIGVSRRCIFDIINVMKMMDAPIKYCNARRSYYYEVDCDLTIGFVEKKKVAGGLKYFNDFLPSANFMHPSDLNCAVKGNSISDLKSPLSA